MSFSGEVILNMSATMSHSSKVRLAGECIGEIVSGFQIALVVEMLLAVDSSVVFS